MENGKKQNKVLYFSGEINPKSASEFLSSLMQMDSEDGLNTVFLFSGGGELKSGFLMYDAIKCCKNQVVTVAAGEVASAAVLPFVAGDARLVLPSASMFLHETISIFQQDVAVKHGELKKVSVAGKDAFEFYCKTLSKETKVPWKTIANLCIGETTLNATQMCEAGFCDGVYAHNNNKVSDVTTSLGLTIKSIVDDRGKKNASKSKRK
jgi:ATP-dependent protease ClpP protease subunit